MTTKTLDFINIERKLFWMLFGGIIFAVGFYLYTAVSLTMAVIERDEAVSSSRSIALSVSNQEQEYMQLKNTVTLSTAVDQGFKEVTPKYASNSFEPDAIAILR